ncbi:PaaI family thioesterase [Nitrogeniibacter mangrovi]|uniref:Medium/long-chain acyl-CoA thioesterase YigI n=2 Tax=Nitrogeniibacter mangrovi TaxID=2016596 RepID=A0A6C1B7J8_9RHOO|nr:PaaI family thioesterase [Nitrogeniibacter mangrovi]
MGFVGAVMTHLAPGECTIELPYREELSQHHGYFHGGVIGMLADNAAGFAGYTLMPDAASVLTVEYKINLLAPAAGERMIAEGSVVRAGRNLVITRAEVFVARGDERIHCATMQQTLMTMHPA